MYYQSMKYIRGVNYDKEKQYRKYRILDHDNRGVAGGRGNNQIFDIKLLCFCVFECKLSV